MNMVRRAPSFNALLSVGERRVRDCLVGWQQQGVQASVKTLEPLKRLLGYSNWAAGVCQHQPHWVLSLLEIPALQKADRIGLKRRVSKALSGIDHEDQFMMAIRQLRQRELLRIAWRDIEGFDSISIILCEQTWLAEILIHEAVCFAGRYHQSQFPPDWIVGQVPALTVFGLGKLGGRELNFSSDVDLIFGFDDQMISEPNRARAQEWFVRLGQRLIRLLGATTQEGFVYRVDMRLRPFGDVGALCLPFSSMEAYYQNHGREWERYALIKARPIAGDIKGGLRLLRRLRPFVYRRYLDMGVLGALRDLKKSISEQAQKHRKNDDIKIGSGGIREIEFIAQSFQLIYGGRNAVLRHPGTRDALNIMLKQALMPSRSISRLLDAYDFLRVLENRLQISHDFQIHTIPTGSSERLLLSGVMGMDCFETLLGVWGKYRQFVSEQFEMVFSSPQIEEQQDPISKAVNSAWTHNTKESWSEVLSHIGFPHPARDAALVQTFVEASRRQFATGSLAPSIIPKLMPLLLRATVRQPRPEQTLDRLLNIVRAVQGRPSYLIVLIESPLALSQLVALVSESAWIALETSRMPHLLDELVKSDHFYLMPTESALNSELRSDVMGDFGVDYLENAMNSLRRFKQRAVLRVAISELNQSITAQEVGRRLSLIGQVIIQFVLNALYQELSRKYPAPHLSDGRRADMLLIAYGKMGMREMGYQSDLDLVFLYESSASSASDARRQDVANQEFFSRLMRRFVHFLTAYTMMGKLYEIDLRLRPSGTAGLLVSSIDAFADYQLHHAWLWEHQALIAARPVAGSQKLAQRFSEIRRKVLIRPRDPNKTAREIAKMRRKMWRQSVVSQGGDFDLKRDSGGMIDIEFIVQYIALIGFDSFPVLSEKTGIIELLSVCVDTRLLAVEDGDQLQKIYIKLQERSHALFLDGRPPVDRAEVWNNFRQVVDAVRMKYLGI